MSTVPRVPLGKSGLKVSKIILGCMSYGQGNSMPWTLSEQEGIEHIKFAYDNGINTFDTANIYSNGGSELVLGKAIKELKLPRKEIVVMTKVFGVVLPNLDDPPFMDIANADSVHANQWGLSRKHIFDSVKDSLERLQLDYIDVLQCHRFDPITPIEETMQALHDVVKAGYVRYIGMSSCYAYQFHAMQNYAITNHLTPFISMQNHYNLLYREEEREMFPTLKMFGVGSIPWSPLARGLLTRPADSEATDRAKGDTFTSYLYGGAGSSTVIKKVQEIAEKKGVPMAHVALAWVLNKDGVTAPIVGASSIDKLKDLIAGVSVKLSEEEVKALEEGYVVSNIQGH